jgi:hypothetical protein
MKGKQMTKKTVETIAYKIPTDGKIKIVDREIDLLPMPFEYEKRFLNLIGELLNKTIKANTPDEDPNISTVLTSIRDLLTDSLSFEWLEILPDLVKIIADSYQLGFTRETIKDKMSIPQMIEAIVCQFDCDRTSSEIASAFFLRITKKIPSIDQLTTLLAVINSIVSSQNIPSSSDLQNDTEPPREN